MLLRRQRVPEAITRGYIAKASLKNLGNGTLEFSGNTLKFYIEKGYFKKWKVIVREIPVAEIESVTRVGDEFSIAWKGFTDVFVIEETELIETLHEKITEALKEHRKMLEDEEAAKQERSELARILGVAIEIVDSLFDILRSLHGCVDWNRVMGYLKRSEETVGNFTSQKIAALNLDFATLSLVINKRLPEETAKETCNVLKSLYEYFSGLASKSKPLEQFHSSYYDIKTAVLAYYTLNDIILSTIVGNEEVGKEINELVVMLNNLKITCLKINADAIKDSINRLGVEKGKESVIAESRVMFRQQLKELITPVSA